MKHRPHTAAHERAGRKLTATDPSTTEIHECRERQQGWL